MNHHQTSGVSERDPPEVGGIIRRLATLRARARRLLIASAAASVATPTLAVLLVAAIIDYAVRTPDWLRIGLLVMGLVALGWLIRRNVLPALRFKPDLTEVALRVERSPQGRAAGLEGLLTSGLELAGTAADPTPRTPALTRELASSVVERARRAFERFPVSGLLDVRQPSRRLIATTLCAVGVGLIAVAVGPALTGIAAARLLTPWAGVQWPKRTAVADATGLAVHPIGEALPLRAALTRSDIDPKQARVEAFYRVRVEDQVGPVQRVLLTAQGRRVNVAVPEPVAPGARPTTRTAEGELFERLIEPELPPAEASGLARRSVEVEYWFKSRDDQTDPMRVRLVDPPAVVGATASITPPSYAASAQGAPFVTGRRELGPGNDPRAIIGPVLAGSIVELTIELNKPVPVPPAGPASDPAVAAFVDAVLPGASLPPEALLAFDGPRWTIRLSPEASLRLPVRPSDEFGLRAREEAAFSLDVAADRPPQVAILEPRDDEAVLPTAVVQLLGEARDDVALGELWLTRQRSTPPPGSAGRAPEPVGEPEVVSRLPAEADAPELGPSARLGVTLDLGTLSLAPGDELVLHALASDTFERSGQTRDPTRSSPRRLRIIAPEQLEEQIRAELGNLRQGAIRIDAEQARLRRAVDTGSIDTDQRAAQGQVARQITQQMEAVARLQERVERNRLDDEGVRDLLGDVASLLDQAAPAAQAAASQMDEAARRQAPPDEPPANPAALTPQEQERIAAEQERVRDALGELAQMLDRGEDSWLVGRALQRLLEQQRALRAQTQRAGQEAAGRPASELAPAQQQQLRDLADQQQRLAEQARAALDQLAQRARQMQSVDAAQAQGMRQAEQRGRQEQVERRMADAAQALEQNQTSTADAQQQAAQEALEQMVEDLQNARRNREIALRRILADVLQALDRLIAEQGTQLDALLAARAQPDPLAAAHGLDAPQIALSTQTLAVAEQARGDRATAAIAATISRAAESQSSAVVALRARPAVLDDAERHQRESLRLLIEARDQARTQQEQAQREDRDRERRELRQAYREQLELQVAIADETAPLAEKPLDRRQRLAVRALGERQSAIQAALAELRAKTEDLADAAVFGLAHDRLDAATGLAAKRLADATADAAVRRHQRAAIRLLRALVEALDDQASDEDELRDDEGGGGGGEGGQGGQRPPLIPPLAELRLLRHMQQELADRTRDAEQAPDEAELRRLAEDQRRLADRGKELIERLQQQQPAQPGRPEAPDPEQPPEPR